MRSNSHSCIVVYFSRSIDDRRSRAVGLPVGHGDRGHGSLPRIGLDAGRTEGLEHERLLFRRGEMAQYAIIRAPSK